MAITAVGDSESFAYTGEVQEFVVPISGIYELTCIGATGGRCTSVANFTQAKAGQGGTTVAYERLKKGTIVYVVVGGGGKNGAAYENNSLTKAGGYNGGGSAEGFKTSTYTLYGTGGGATHIATTAGLLPDLEEYQDTILAVAGGGAGAWSTFNGSNVGNYTGYGGNGDGGSGVFGQGTTFGGGGYDGGHRRTGGTGYLRTTETIVVDEITYTPTITEGSSGSVSSASNGSAKITLISEVADIAAYLGDMAVEAMYLGDASVEHIVLGIQ